MMNLMGSYITNHIHAIFSTKFREPLIDLEFESSLYKYIAGIGRNKGIPILKIGGMSDHIHILFQLPSTMPMTLAIQLLKGSSSKWINDTYYSDRRFQWQGGYSAFCVSYSNLDKVKSYLKNQKKHHRYYNFQEEHKSLLLRNGIHLDNKRGSANTRTGN